MAKLVVVEGSPDALADALAEVRADGRALIHGWDVSAPGADVVCTGTVDDAEDAAAALLAAIGGAGLVVDARAEREVVDRLCEDLRRIGRLDHRTRSTPRAARLAPEQRALLGLLAGGLTLGEAARRLHVSRRTADRRLAAAREALGVPTTAEAIVAFSRRGG